MPKIFFPFFNISIFQLNKRSVLSAISEHLLVVALGIVKRDIDNLPLGIMHWQHAGIEESLVGSDVKSFIALENLGMEFGIDVNTVSLNQCPTCLVVALALYSLHLGEERGKLTAKGFVVVDLHVGLAVALHKRDGIAIVKTPVGNESTIAHVCLLNLVAWSDAHEL